MAAMQSNATDDVASGPRSKVHDQFDKMSETATKAAQNIAGRAAEVGENVKEVAGNVQSAVQKSATEQPMATIAVAAVLGFVLGAVWKS